MSLMTVTLRLRSSVPPGTHSNVTSVQVQALMNPMNMEFIQDTPAQINDEQGGAQTYAQVMVESSAVIGEIIAKL